MQQMIHLALAPNGFVLAQFADSEHAAAWCLANGATHVPYNLANRDKVPAPPVGTMYQAQ